MGDGESPSALEGSRAALFGPGVTGDAAALHGLATLTLGATTEATELALDNEPFLPFAAAPFFFFAAFLAAFLFKYFFQLYAITI